MAENPTQKQNPADVAVSLVYFLLAMGITMFILFKDLWPSTMFIEWHLGDDNMYPSKLVFMETLICVGLVLFPEYWIVKKIINVRMKKKQEQENP